MKTIHDLQLSGKRVLVRADVNVPLNEKNEITDDTRIREFLPTLRLIMEKGGRPIVMSHLGRPAAKGDPSFSLKPVAVAIHKALGVKVTLAPDCVGPSVKQLAEQVGAGEILLLENLRYRDEEEKNDDGFAKELASLGDVYINDAFATTHRKHASLVGVPKYIGESGIGLLMQKELDFYQRALVQPKKPLCAILGGAKVSSKLQALINMADKADKIVIGGAMANTFLAAQGIQMGRSLYEPDLFPKILELMGSLARRNCALYLPVDVVVAPSLNSQGLGRAVPVQEIPADTMALDIGPATSILYREAIHSAETIVWNGPMGAFEKEDFARGTHELTEAVAAAHGLTVAGGGDTVAAIAQMELEHKFDYISTGGGAFLTLLEGKTLPALEVLG